MALAQFFVHVTIIVSLVISYVTLVLTGNDGTAILGILAGYVGARGVDIGFVTAKNGFPKS